MFIGNENTPSMTKKWLDGEGTGKGPDLEWISPMFFSFLLGKKASVSPYLNIGVIPTNRDNRYS